MAAHKLGVILICCGVWLLSSPPQLFAAGDVAAAATSVEAQASNMLSSLQNGVAGVLAVGFGFLIRLIHATIPGIAIALIFWTIYRLTRAGAKAWTPRTFLGLAVAGGLTYGLIRLGGGAQQPRQADGLTLNRDQTGREILSGELVLLQSGEVGIRAHPQANPGSVVPSDWRDHLAQAIQSSLMNGDAQVVLEFTRRGCTYCHKQLPVLQEAVQRRAADTGALAPGLAFAGAPSRAGSMLFAPLRIFILDADEFQELANGFKVQAFPTMWFFGQPHVDPMVRQGFTDSAQLEEILRVVALKAPPEPQRKKGFFGLR